ncbi:helix-turn-helix domain-containing protein [Arthrobacter frigidicola]|nr:helix-turn-helix domain-containing protein [Arthrobacter frigidicola]
MRQHDHFAPVQGDIRDRGCARNSLVDHPQREEIAVRRAQGRSLRRIAAVIGVSTVSREVRRNTRPGAGYRATAAHSKARGASGICRSRSSWDARGLQFVPLPEYDVEIRQVLF